MTNTLAPTVEQTNACAESMVMKLRELTASSMSTSFWLICDPMLEDPLKNLPELAGLRPQVIDLQHSGLSRASSPFLVELNDAGIGGERQLSAAVHEMVRQARRVPEHGQLARSLCCLLNGRGDAARWRLAASRSAALWDANGARRIFRFWEPRGLGAALKSPALSELLQGLPRTEGVLLDSWGALQTFSLGKAEAQTQTPIGADTTDRRLNVERMTALTTIGRRNAVIAKLQAAGVGPVPDTQIDTTLADLSTATWLLADEQIDFAAHCLRLRSPLQLAPEVQQLANVVAATGVRYSQIVGEWDEQAWHQVSIHANEIMAKSKGAKT